MNIEPGPILIEPATSRSAGQAQPVEALANLDPLLDETAVRQAIADAESKNLDPQTLTLSDLAQGPEKNPPVEKPVEVPQKFLKPDGAVDVDKLQASTQALDAAIQKKEEAITKTVDDYMREYNEKQTKFRTMPNPERVAVPPALAPPVPSQNEPQSFEEIVRRDYQNDPLLTTTRLIDLAIQKRMEPLEVKERNETIRSNLQALAAKDSRVMRGDIYEAIQAKLNSDPDLWKLKNPHKAAWLEVKEELRLGEPTMAPAQPSKPLSPVLGGGTPPSAPSTSVASPQAVIQNLNALDLRDKKQEAMGDEAIRQMLANSR